jgi:membrane-associated phospholipid phosphatase
MAGFLGLMGWAGRLRPEHALVVAVMVACVATDRSRRFAILLMPMCLIGILYDVQKVWTLSLPVHVAGPNELERALFGVPTGSGRIMPNEIFLAWHTPALDVLTAIPYLTYIFEALGLFGFLFVKDKERCWRFGWIFFAVNLAGLATNALFPVAPPWYVTEHGLGPVVRGVAGSPAAALRFDDLTGGHLFAALYARESDTFGAIPSLHAAYPLLVALMLRELGARRLATLAWAYMALMCFAAVYLQHHYVIDVIAGLAYAGVGHAVVTRGMRSASEGSLEASPYVEKAL